MRISDWSSDVCSSDLTDPIPQLTRANDLTIVRHHPGGLVQLSCQFNGMDMMESIFHTADARRVAVALETTSEAATELSNLFEQDGFGFGDRKSTRLNSSHSCAPRMPPSA